MVTNVGQQGFEGAKIGEVVLESDLVAHINILPPSSPLPGVGDVHVGICRVPAHVQGVMIKLVTIML